VDVSDPTSDDFLQLAEEFKFHPLSIEDVQHEHQRPKIEEHQGYYFVVIYAARMSDDQSLELVELNVFLGKNYVVTVHSKPLPQLQTVFRLWKEWAEKGGEGTGLLMYLLVDTIVDEYMPILDAISDRVDEVEQHIFGHFKQESIQDIFYAKKQLLYLRRAVAPLREVFNVLLRREQPIFEQRTYLYFQDVFDHVLRVTDTIDTLREMVSSTMDAYLSISGNRMNLIMKRLTSIATILMSVTLIASIYGMNFAIMPELNWKYGYVFALSVMLVVGILLYLFLRRTRWL
jgi:magnesium transporter